MVKLNIIKSGKFAFQGINVKLLEAGESEYSDRDAKELIDSGWAEYKKEEPVVDPEVVEDNQVENMDKEQLRFFCESNGIEIEGRWSEKKAREAVEEYLAKAE